MQTPSSPVQNSRQRSAPATLPPFDAALRYTISEAAAYLRTSRVSIYKLLHAGELEGIKERSRTFVTGRSIAALCAPRDATPWVPNRSRRARAVNPAVKTIAKPMRMDRST